MSTNAPIYAHAVPVSRTPSGSVWPWVIVIIILIAVIIALAIWLAVRHTNDSSNCKTKTFNLPGAKITAGRTSIQGSWTALENENDVVTLCVSTRPLEFGSDGSVIKTTNVICDSKDSITKEGGTVEITGLTSGVVYNAAMTVTSTDATNYRIYGPKRVFTQTEDDIKAVTFNIRDLNSCIGAVSNSATYTTDPTKEGNYRFGQVGNSSHNTFIIKYEDGEDFNTETDPPLILCKRDNSLDVVLAEWEADNNIHLPAPNEDVRITNVDQCLWGYNSSPPDGASGENRWCLSGPQKVSDNNQTVTENLCLSRSGTSSLSLQSITTGGVTGADMWLNQLYPTS